MTVRRQENKEQRRMTAVFAAFFAVFLGLFDGAALAGPSERTVSDRYTGLAIGGYDPVAYFTEKAARQGMRKFEASQQGAVWRFLNDRNRSVFLADPDIYGPQFGGYDPVDLARGKIVAGRPDVWLISGDRLYLFNRSENRDAFAADKSRLEEATKRWPDLSATLADY